MMGARHLCTITRILTQDNLPASRQGIQEFLKKYIERLVLLTDRKVQVRIQR